MTHRIMINKMSIDPLTKYNKLRKRLKNHFKSAAEIANAMYEEGKKKGLSNERIRSDIESDLKDIVKDRRLREIMPQALKRPYNRILPNLTTSIESDSNNIRPISKLTLKERENLPEVIACRIVEGNFKVIEQDLINYPIAEDDPLSKELAEAFEEHHDFLMNPNDKKYKHLRMKIKDFYESDEYKQLNTSARLVNPNGTPIFKEITKEQGALTPIITTQYEYTVYNFFLSRLILALIKYYRKYVQPWVEKRAMNVKKKLSFKA